MIGSEKIARLLPRLIRLRDAPIYIGIDRNRFNRDVRPYLIEIPITEYLATTEGKASLADDAMHLKLLDLYIGDLALDQIHMGTLRPFIEDRKKAGIRDPKQGVKNRTINYSLQVVRRIRHQAAYDWRDQSGLTWVATAPKIQFLPEHDRRKPYPMSWEEQHRLFRELPPHLQRMALFKVNTGCREAEVCTLQWEWEIRVPELDTTVFLMPAQCVKNREERLVVQPDCPNGDR